MHLPRRTALIAALLLVTAAAHAAPIVVLANSQVVKEVDGIVVDGSTYNVTFVADAVDHTFDNNAIGESIAATELENALNATTAPYVNLAGVGTINQFVVGDILTGGIELTSFFAAGNWQSVGIVENDGSAAVFTPVSPMPEPATLLLFAAGLAALVVLRRPVVACANF